ncbi:MAG: proton-conducting transporter membrane subunit, partial [candidate division WOR-3 bacterium]
LATSATLPLYIWWPRAYGVASIPACAFLSGVAENIGPVLFYRLFGTTFVPPAGFLQFTAGLALTSSLVAGAAALRTKSVRGLLAYSTVSQLGLVLLGLAVGGFFGILGAVLYMAAHALAKAGLFYAVGLVQDDTTDELVAPGEIAVRSPTLVAATAVLTFSVVGLPPTIGFAAKLGVLVGAGRSDLLLAIGGAVSALLTLLYMVRFYTSVFLTGCQQPAARTSRIGVVLVVLMSLVTVLGGFGWFIPVRLITLGLPVGWLP